MIHTAIILVGGLGTRLRPVISDLPKALAPVNNRPFLFYVFDYLLTQNIQKVILCTGYLHEKVYEIIGNSYKRISITYSVENEPLGTGGAVKKACPKIIEETFFLLNGDTLFTVNLKTLAQKHYQNKSDLTIALREVSDASRYGRIVRKGSRIIGFMEKGVAGAGEINGGIYVIEKKMCEHFPAASSFSFEKDFLEKNVNTLNCNGVVSDSYFIDIGIPDDYIRATQELPIT